MAAIDTNIGARTDGAVSKTNGHLIRVGPRAELRGVTVVSGGRHGIAVFLVGLRGSLRRRQPLPTHGVPAAQGKRRRRHPHLPLASRPLRSGERRHVRSLGRRRPNLSHHRRGRHRLRRCARPHGDDRVAHAKARLWDGLEHNLNLVVVKNVLALLEADVPPAEILAIGGRFGATYRRGGWAAGLTILTAMGNVLPKLHPRTRRSPCTTAWSTSPATAGQPPRLRSIPSQRAMVPLGPIACGSVASSTSATPTAPSALLTAIAADLPPSTLADVLASAATDHFFLDGGHTLDFVNKACELLDMIGWQEATTILPSLVPGLAMARRSEELNSWRHPVDLVALLEPEFTRLPEFFAAAVVIRRGAPPTR